MNVRLSMASSPKTPCVCVCVCVCVYVCVCVCVCVTLALTGNPGLCRLASHGLLLKLMVQMQRSYQHGVRAPGLVNAALSIVQGSATLLMVRS